MLRLALKQSLIHSKPSPLIYFGIHAQIRDFLYIYSVFFPHYISLTRLQIMKRQFTLETVMVDNSTNIDKNQQLLLKHKKRPQYMPMAIQILTFGVYKNMAG